jgi:MFS family permease
VTNEFRRGWPTLTGSFLGIGVSLVSLTYYSAGIWVKPWQEAFGWSRAEIGTGQSLMTVTLILSAPLAGKLIDRYGLRSVSTISLLLYAFGLLAVSKMTGELWLYYVLAVSFTLVGVASTPLGFTRAVNAWFTKNRGLALGLSLTSTGVAAFLLPKYLTPYVAVHGWREGYFILFVIAVVAVPLVWLLIRDHPPEAEVKSEAGQEALLGVTLREAMRTRVFWSIAALFLLVATAVLGTIPSFIPLLQDAGLDATRAGELGAVLGVSVMGGRLVTGFLIDRIFAPYVTAVIFTFVAAGCLALGVGGISYAFIAAIALGFAVGAEVDLIGYFTARYFGLANYGTIYGVQYSVFSLGAGISPVLAGYIWDVNGNYDVALIGGAVLLAVAVVVALTLPRFEDVAGQDPAIKHA